MINDRLFNTIDKKPVISSITFYEDNNFVNMSDTDSQTDYFNNANLGTKHLIEWLTTENGYGASEVVNINFINNKELPKFHQRLRRIAKAINYKIAVREKRGIYRIYENDFKCEINPYVYNEYKIYNSNLVQEKDLIW